MKFADKKCTPWCTKMHELLKTSSLVTATFEQWFDSTAKDDVLDFLNGHYGEEQSTITGAKKITRMYLRLTKASRTRCNTYEISCHSDHTVDQSATNRKPCALNNILRVCVCVCKPVFLDSYSNSFCFTLELETISIGFFLSYIHTEKSVTD